MNIAREGMPLINVFALLTVIVFFLSRNWLTAIPLLALCFIVYFFRDPERDIPEEALSIVSPADGKIIAIEAIFEYEYLNKNVRKISIFMSPFDVHVNRSPYDGDVLKVIYTPGAYHKASTDEASRYNENIAMLLKTAMGNVLVRQIAGVIARRTVTRVASGDTLKKGERFGVIKFSSRVEVYLPLNAKLTVSSGDRVVAGSTVIAKWEEPTAKQQKTTSTGSFKQVPGVAQPVGKDDQKKASAQSAVPGATQKTDPPKKAVPKP